jgi:hypothetical protein
MSPGPKIRLTVEKRPHDDLHLRIDHRGPATIIHPIANSTIQDAAGAELAL